MRRLKLLAMPFESVNEQCLGQDDVGLELCKKFVQIAFFVDIFSCLAEQKDWQD